MHEEASMPEHPPVFFVDNVVECFLVHVASATLLYSVSLAELTVQVTFSGYFYALNERVMVELDFLAVVAG